MFSVYPVISSDFLHRFGNDVIGRVDVDFRLVVGRAVVDGNFLDGVAQLVTLIPRVDLLGS